MLSDIYYRLHFFYETVSGGASIAGKIAVQVNANATRDHFGGVAGGGREFAQSALFASSAFTLQRERIGSPLSRDAQTGQASP